MNQPSIEIYTRRWCPYCVRAKGLLDDRRIAYREYDVDADPQRYEEMLDRAEGRRTVPQIFIGGIGIGGCTELMALQSSGELESRLGS